MMNQINSRSNDRKEETPPYSRIFVVCNKLLKEEDLSRRFERFGEIEDLFIPKDRNTGDSKGVAYIKYAKTSSAAAAIQELHMKLLYNDSKPTKVMVAVNRNESPAQNDSDDRYRRLFIKVSKEATETEVRHHFSTFGHVESVRLQRDKLTDTCKGFAYVQYKSFLGAAKAYEECDKKYKPVFAIPRDDLKRSRNSLDSWAENNMNFKSFNGSKTLHNNNYPVRNDQPRFDHNYDNKSSNALTNLEDFNTVEVKCSPQVPQRYIEQLFHIVPGMVQCQYSSDTFNGMCKAFVTYDDPKFAKHACERLNNFEFPSGEIISVKPDTNPLSRAANNLSNIVNNFKNAVDSGTPDLQQLADAIAKASCLIKAATQNTSHIEQRETTDSTLCNVSLPPPKPLVDYNSKVAQRLFIICKPQPPPIPILQDVFCCFGNLIHVSTIPNKTYGFVKYAVASSAQEAIKTLNGAIVGGAKLKVMEADEKPSKEEVQKPNECNEKIENTDYDMESKRIKLNEN